MSENLHAIPEIRWWDEDLCIEQIPFAGLARRFGTPLYVYSRAALTRAADGYLSATQRTNARVFYAVKANASLAVIDLFSRLGCGFDIVSGGELAKVLAAGADPKSVVYSGVGKTTAEIETALKVGILCFNVESEPELDRIAEIAAHLEKTADISIRVNPNVDAKTHPYISTGLKNNKFGIAYERVIEVYKKARTLTGIRVAGIDCHIGSQITSLDPFVHAADKVLDLVDELGKAGVEIRHLDFGGGLGVCYLDEEPPAAGALMDIVRERCTARGYGDLPLFFEPGRSLVANAGVLLSQVQYVKRTDSKNFCIVDAAMNDMIRPTLYDAHMAVLNTRRRPQQGEPFDIVGPVCESGDFLGKDRTLAVEPGDILAMTGAGAYGMAMSSNYNMRGRAAEVLVDGDKAYLVRRRETPEDLCALETRLPD